MRFFRLIIRDRLTAWLLAGLLAYFLGLQGVTTAFAKGSMVAVELGATLVNCAPSGTQVPGAGPVEDLAKECCGSLCQAGCSTGPFLWGSLFPLAGRTATARAFAPRFMADRSPQKAGLVQDARAPPAFSV